VCCIITGVRICAFRIVLTIQFNSGGWSYMKEKVIADGTLQTLKCFHNITFEMTVVLVDGDTS